mgnify:FL=1
MVPVSTFARGSHGGFNENTHAFYTKHAMASAKRVRKKMTPYTTAIRFGITLGVKKEKGQRFNTSDLCFRWWAIQDSNL